LTLPSHASILTGLYPPEHGLHDNGIGRLESDVPCLAEILRDLNYDTGAFLSAFVLNSKFGLNRGFQTYDDDLSGTAQADSFVHRRRDGRAVMDAALEWLQRRGSRPFFCWVHLYDAHAAYDARELLFGDRFVGRPYDAGIAAEDVQVRRLIDFLKSRRLTDRTLVVVVGDHGEGLMEHGEQEHGLLLYEAAVRVPLIVAGPRFVKGGRHVSTAVSLVDLAPTILDCLSVDHKPSMSGRSLKRALEGEDVEPCPCYAETEAPVVHGWAPLRAVITSRHKYIRTTQVELYNLIDDRGEKRNLAQADGEALRKLAAALDEMLARFTPRLAGAVHVSQKERQALSSLGYTSGKRAAPEADSQEELPDVKEMLPVYNMALDVKSLLAAQQTTAAVEKLHAILEIAPRYYEARVLLGDALTGQKNHTEAALVYESVLREYPDQPMAHAHLADALAALGRLPEAVAHYRRALEIDSEAASWHLHLAQVLSALENSQEAMAEYEEALRCDPGFVKAHLEFGSLLSELGRSEEAIGHFEMALRLHPGLPVARANLERAREALKAQSP
jgi:arylsulfatase A-like enzyme/Flp pilus assembly protein TadD